MDEWMNGRKNEGNKMTVKERRMNGRKDGWMEGKKENVRRNKEGPHKFVEQW